MYMGCNLGKLFTMKVKGENMKRIVCVTGVNIKSRVAHTHEMGYVARTTT